MHWRYFLLIKFSHSRDGKIQLEHYFFERTVLMKYFFSLKTMLCYSGLEVLSAFTKSSIQTHSASKYYSNMNYLGWFLGEVGVLFVFLKEESLLNSIELFSIMLLCQDNCLHIGCLMQLNSLSHWAILCFWTISPFNMLLSCIFCSLLTVCKQIPVCAWEVHSHLLQHFNWEVKSNAEQEISDKCKSSFEFGVVVFDNAVSPADL